MRIVQNTTDIPTKKIREIIEFVKPSNLPTSNFDVRITNSTGDTTGYAIPSRIRPAVVIRVGREEEGSWPCYNDNSPEVRRPWRRVSLYYEKFDEKRQHYRLWRVTHQYQSIKDKEKKMSQGGYLSDLTLSREESIVHMMAHELRHLWHKNHPGKRGRVWGARGQYSDRDADAYAIRKQREWRKVHSPKEIYPDLTTIGVPLAE